MSRILTDPTDHPVLLFATRTGTMKLKIWGRSLNINGQDCGRSNHASGPTIYDLYYILEMLIMQECSLFLS